MNLLSFYPAAYRRERGDELLETLHASTGDRPSSKEVAALILGGLRAHAGSDHRRTARQSWLAASRVAALMLLIYGIAGSTQILLIGIPYTPSEAVMGYAAAALALVALIEGLRNHYLAAAVVSTASFALAAGNPGPQLNGYWHLPFAVVLFLVLARHRPQPVTGLLRWAPAIPVLLIAADAGLGTAFPDVAGILRFGAFAAVVLGGLLWLAVDERVALAVGMMFGGTLLIQLVLIASFAAGGNGLPAPGALAGQLALTGLPPVLLLLLGGTVARRQAAL